MKYRNPSRMSIAQGILYHIVFALTIPVKRITGKAVFHPTIQTVGFQTAFSVTPRLFKFHFFL
jgi:hypothetical protein